MAGDVKPTKSVAAPPKIRFSLGSVSVATDLRNLILYICMQNECVFLAAGRPTRVYFRMFYVYFYVYII